MDSFLLIGRFPRSWLRALHRGFWCCSVLRFLRDGGIWLRCLAEVQSGKERRVGAGSAYAETSVHCRQSGVLKIQGREGSRSRWTTVRPIRLIDRSTHIVTFMRGQLFHIGVFLSRAESQGGMHGACFSRLDAFSVQSHVCVACVRACVYSFIYIRARVHSTFLSSIYFFLYL